MNDIGYYDETGEIYIVGRMSEFIKCKECCLSVTEIESVLDMHPAVFQSIVVPIPADIEGELPFAIVVTMPNKQVFIASQKSKRLFQQRNLLTSVLFHRIERLR